MSSDGTPVLHAVCNLVLQGECHTNGPSVEGLEGSSEEDVIERLNTRGLTREDAKKRISSQMPTAEKKKLADYVVQNHGTLGELEAVIQETIKAIRG